MQINLTIHSQLIVYVLLSMFWGSIAAYVLKSEKKLKAR